MMQTVRAEFFAISVERSVKHPAVAAIINGARHIFAAFEAKPPASSSRLARPGVPTRATRHRRRLTVRDLPAH